MLTGYRFLSFSWSLGMALGDPAGECAGDWVPMCLELGMLLSKSFFRILPLLPCWGMAGFVTHSLSLGASKPGQAEVGSASFWLLLLCSCTVELRNKKAC